MQGQWHLAGLQNCRDLFEGETTWQGTSHICTTAEEEMTQKSKEPSKGSSFFMLV